MDAKFKDTPSEKLDMCLKQQFSPNIVNEFFACMVAIYDIKEWTDLYTRQIEGKELNVNLVFAYSDKLTESQVKALKDFLFQGPRLKSE